MGCQYQLNYVLIMFVVQEVIECLDFDVGNRNFRKPPLPFQWAFKNPDVHNLTTPKQTPYWKRSSPNYPNNYKEGNYFRRNIKSSTHTGTTVRIRKKSSLISHYVSKLTTPSYIEFYYLDENLEEIHKNNMKMAHRLGSNNNKVTTLNCLAPSRRPNVHTPHSSNTNSQTPPNFQVSVLYPLVEPNFNNIGLIDLMDNVPFENQKVLSVKKYLKDNIEPTELYVKETKEPAIGIQQKTYFTNTGKPAKVYLKDTKSTTKSVKTPTIHTSGDRVKFFDMYDIGTLRPLTKNFKQQISTIKSESSYNIRLNKLSDDNNNSWPNNLNANKTFKKDKNFKKRSFDRESRSNVASANKIQQKKVMDPIFTTTKNTTIRHPKLPVMTETVTHWSKYPYASVYIYKPTQVLMIDNGLFQTHCDAAGIRPHWLVAAGSCLSRRNLVHSLDARSAYVTYCGDVWRVPERIAYVKRTIVHPDFSHRDEVRRHLYNIGLIQVSSSLAASCSTWTPISLISHYFSTEQTGTLASAVGWGVDRYGTEYSTEKLPSCPLTVYNALVYHDTCPGSPKYSWAKEHGEEGANNVYCLLLPPYAGEDADPVHGGLLLVGEKLVALYLREERRPWGTQSAQYTGVWRLLPWILEEAREPDDMEAAWDI